MTSTSKRILRVSPALERLGLSRSTLYRLLADEGNGFPKRLQLSANIVGFIESEIDEWIATRPVVGGVAA